jgi:hypothetical protein
MARAVISAGNNRHAEIGVHAERFHPNFLGLKQSCLCNATQMAAGLCARSRLTAMNCGMKLRGICNLTSSSLL